MKLPSKKPLRGPAQSSLAFGYEFVCIRTHPARVLLRAFFQHTGHTPEIRTRNAVRDDNQPMVGACVFERLNRKGDEIFPVSGDDGSLPGNSFGELILIGCPRFADIVRADGVDSTLAQDFGNPRADVLVKAEFHSAAGFLARNGNRLATFSLVRSWLRAIRASISSG